MNNTVMDLEILDRQSEEIKSFFCTMNEVLGYVEEVVKNNKPHLNGEKFLGNKDVCRLLHLSPRTLQEYRDKGIIAFIKLKGKILYRQSDVVKMLSDNFFPVIE
ncbi:Helix-turn-helix domain protein [Bacteroidales bacterium Barb6XT]|nr:Helix-turn-helix domain protein [Bacteroidales bacterium Barb6XT]